MRCDLLEEDRRRDRRRRAAWCVGCVVVLLCSGWMLRGPVGAYLQASEQRGDLAAGPAHALGGSTAGELSRAGKQAPGREPGEGAQRGQDARQRPQDEEDAQQTATGRTSSATSSARGDAATSSVQTRPLSAWLGEVAREAGRDLVLSPELRGDLTATVGGALAWEQRLAAFARVFGFDFTVGDGLIEVRPQARMHVSARDLGGRESGASTAGNDAAASGAARADAHGAAATASAAGQPDGAASSSATSPAAGGAAAAASDKPEPPIETRVAPLAHAPAKEMAAVLAKAGEPLGIAVVPEVSSNSLLVSGTRRAIDRAFALLHELDRPRRRVLLEAKIVELTHSARLDLGVDWKLAGDTGAEVKFPPPTSVTGSAALVLATGGAHALDARISAMEADGRVRVVSRPSVVMLEGSPATVESVRILRIRLPSRGSVVGGDVVEVDNGQRATEEIPVGVRLEVTPAVRAGRRVLLRIKAKSSSLGAPLPPDDIPEELSRMVDAELLVADGETAVLGGLRREAGQHGGAGVPVLREVPLLGGLFGRRSREREAEELLVMVTPRVMD